MGETELQHHGVKGMRWGVRRKRTAGSVKKARTDKGNKTASKTVARREKKKLVRKEKVKQALQKQVKKSPNHNADGIQASIAGLAMYGISNKVWGRDVTTSAITGVLAAYIMTGNKTSN